MSIRGRLAGSREFFGGNNIRRAPGAIDTGVHITAVIIVIVTLLAGAAASLGLQYLLDRRSANKQALRESSNYKQLELGGDWIAFWQSRVEGKENINSEVVHIRQQRNLLLLKNDTVSPENTVGGYLWKGELRIYDNQHLCGHYIADQPNVLSKGAFYFVLHYSGTLMEGGRTGCSYDGDLITGGAVMARTRERAEEAMTQLRKTFKASRVRRK